MNTEDVDQGPTGRLKGPEWVENRAFTGVIPTLRLREVWDSRELTYFFFLRDLKVQYKQTLIGAGWVVMGPLMSALTFTFMLNRLGGIEAQGSYFVFALTGLIVWSFISGVMGSASDSLLDHEDLITHVAFPKIAAPLATVPMAAVNLGVGLAVAVVAALVWNEQMSVVGLLIGIPSALILMTVTALGPGLFFAAAIVKYRDSGTFFGLGIQLLFLLSPVAYPPELIGEEWRTLQFLNPVTSSLALFRWGFTPAGPPAMAQVVVSTAVAVLALIVGFTSFRRNEQVLVDVI